MKQKHWLLSSLVLLCAAGLLALAPGCDDDGDTAPVSTAEQGRDVSGGWYFRDTVGRWYLTVTLRQSGNSISGSSTGGPGEMTVVGQRDGDTVSLAFSDGEELVVNFWGVVAGNTMGGEWEDSARTRSTWKAIRRDVATVDWWETH